MLPWADDEEEKLYHEAKGATVFSPDSDGQRERVPSGNERARAAIAAHALGIVTGLSTMLICAAPRHKNFAIYLMLLSSHHMAEYFLTATYRPDTLSFDSFLINHSRLYQFMIILSWVEYWVEAAFTTYSSASWLKEWTTLSWIGLLLCLVGFVTRSLAMVTAASNFSHLIEDDKRENHVLVTHGIYRWLRHPAYFGYFYWAVGTQALLANPVCLIAYTIATFLFFLRRIPFEEQLLLNFFGNDYRRYRQRTWIGIPFLAWLIG